MIRSAGSIGGTLEATRVYCSRPIEKLLEARARQHHVVGHG